MGYLGVRLLKALVEKDEKTVGEMLPKETSVIDTGVRVIVPVAYQGKRSTKLMRAVSAPDGIEVP